jgi:hypothetical protein
MTALGEAVPGLRIEVTTLVPEWFWSGIPGLVVRSANPGPLPVEIPGSTDFAASARELDRFEAHAEETVEEEAARLSRTRPGLVVADIDPVAFAAAELAGVPVVGIANFTWDWIFSRLPGCAAGGANLLASMYSGGEYLRLPMSPPEHPFGRCRDAGLLPGGQPMSTPDRVRRLLGFEGRLLLVSLRDFGRLEGSTLDVPPGWTAVCSAPGEPPAGLVNVPPGALSSLGLGFADLAAAADAVLMAPGYGMASLALALGSRVIVLERFDFPEAVYITAPFAGRAASTTVAAAALSGQGLGDALEKVCSGPAPSPVRDATRDIAAMLLERLPGRSA